MKPQVTLAVRLIRAMHALGHFLEYSPYEVCIRRTYAGVHQRDAGAFSWYAVDLEGMEIKLGSLYPLGLLLQYREFWDVCVPRDTISSIIIQLDAKKFANWGRLPLQSQ